MTQKCATPAQFFFFDHKKRGNDRRPTGRAYCVYFVASNMSFAVAVVASDISEFEHAPRVYETPHGQIVARPSQILRRNGIGWNAMTFEQLLCTKQKRRT